MKTLCRNELWMECVFKIVSEVVFVRRGVLVISYSLIVICYSLLIARCFLNSGFSSKSGSVSVSKTLNTKVAKIAKIKDNQQENGWPQKAQKTQKRNGGRPSLLLNSGVPRIEKKHFVPYVPSVANL